MSTSETIIKDVAQELSTMLFQHKVTVEYPGAIHIATDDGVWVTGTANETWTADFYSKDNDDMGTPDGGLETYVRTDCPDARIIALVLVKQIRAFYDGGGIKN